jgi:anti-anti-sigma factor
MEIRVEKRGSVVVLTPSGDMDSSTLPSFENRFAALLRDGDRSMLWDLGQVGILPSSGVGFLLQAGRRLQALGGRMALARAGKLARSTLSTLGVLDVFRLYDSVGDGVAALQEQAQGGNEPRR